MISLITMELMMGLTGSLHCAGMCGPIIWMMPFRFLSRFKQWVVIMLYHFGRISVYGLFGVILHLFKSSFDPHVQQTISITMGFALLVIGILNFIPQNVIKSKMPWSEIFAKLIGRVAGNPNLSALFVLGALNGFLPCGLVYMALSAAMGSHSTLEAMAGMYAFGVGTMPMLIAITILKNRLIFPRLYGVRRFVPLITFVFGFLFILRGLNLDISYFSPKIEVSEQHEIRASCCSKK